MHVHGSESILSDILFATLHNILRDLIVEAMVEARLSHGLSSSGIVEAAAIILWRRGTGRPLGRGGHIDMGGHRGGGARCRAGRLLHAQRGHGRQWVDWAERGELCDAAAGRRRRTVGAMRQVLAPLRRLRRRHPVVGRRVSQKAGVVRRVTTRRAERWWWRRFGGRGHSGERSRRRWPPLWRRRVRHQWRATQGRSAAHGGAARGGVDRR